MESGTFAIVGRSSDGRRLGVAVAAALPAAGAFCLAARAGVGAVSVQGQVQPALRARLLDLMAEGVAAEEALARIWQADAGRERRQVLALGRTGPATAATGEGVAGFAGSATGSDCAAAGSHLAHADVPGAMAAAFEGSPSSDLPERLMRALEAGGRAGGDARGTHSAAILVVDRDGYPYLDLRVDEHSAPLAELRRLVDHQAEHFLPGYEAWLKALEAEGG